VKRYAFRRAPERPCADCGESVTPPRRRCEPCERQAECVENILMDAAEARLLIARQNGKRHA
jgi:hypothetical protein